MTPSRSLDTPAGIPHAPTFVSLWHEVAAIDLADSTIDPIAVASIPAAIGIRHGIIPVAYEQGAIVLAMTDPGNVVAIDDVRALTGRAVKAVRASSEDVEAAWRRFASPDVSGAIAEAEEEDQIVDRIEIEEDAPVIRLVNTILGRAVDARASDIHVEPNDTDLRVRFRIDGVLHEHMTLSRSLQGRIVSRIKIMADMDIAERRVPQDGRTELALGGRVADLRIASLPTLHGEKVVIRILSDKHAQLGLDDLGLGDGARERLTSSFRRPQGMVLVTGPTGSGKTTTLYATLSDLNETARSIVTVEDPVEYSMRGAYQVQVHPKAGLTFASALRSILRSDPDVIMVGEVRDVETARLAIDAALTGHLVLSSLHTNDAASSLSRLTEMGVESFLVASAVDCVLAQRLLRILCDRCKEPYASDDELVRAAGMRALHRPVTLYRANGCTRCGGTGYRGRTGVYECLVVTEQIERLAADRRPSEEIAAAAVAEGMRPLYADAMEKVLLGVTTIEEVARVVGSPRRAVASPSLGEYRPGGFSRFGRA